jgi:CRISPR type III-A-associated RAMP protein Csm4
MTPGFLALLRPRGPWRLGQQSGARDRVERICHSDTMFAAITSAIARLGMLDEWIAAAQDAQVRLSSCYPFQGKLLFILPPRTLWPPAPSSKVRWKGARFIPTTLIAELLADAPLDENRWRVDGPSECLLPIDRGGVGPTRLTSRSSAAVDRLSGAIELHSTACLEFAPNSGMWLAVSFESDEARIRWSEPVKAALRLLADSGIGGERSRGWGHFEQPEFREGTFPELLVPAPPPEAEPAWWLLSLFHPAEQDGVDWSQGRYDLTARGGRIESPAGWGTQKRLTRMVTEGSVLLSDFPLRGSAPNVAPDGFPHPVLCNGVAFALPIAWKVVLS